MNPVPAGAARSVVIHGHFYQPPRDNPWFDEIEAEPSAAPYHDWNERIERECYRTVIAAHLTAGGADNRIVGIVNTLEWISFNFGATLLQWLDQHAPRTYAGILAADRASATRTGYGNAIAQPYHHVILPLASRRDKLSEVRWGIADFRRRFGRDPLGMWLPETAVDLETLEVLAECGIRFTVLAPHQVALRPANGLPGRCELSGGRSIAVFAYDGGLSHGIAFGGLLDNANTWAARLLAETAKLTAIATDGETYGHHHKFGEMALARVITELNARAGIRMENFASFLAANPPQDTVDVVEQTSWSCAHGVERWRSNCGCRAHGDRYPSQAWRTPLRAGLDVLASGLHARFESEGRAHFADPWGARDRYGTVVDAPLGTREQFVRDEAAADTAGDTARALELLEMERDALRMYASCAWFFDDIGGIEPRQVLQYAAHACDLAAAGDPVMYELLEEGLLAYLAQAASNDSGLGTGRDIYLRQVRPKHAADARVAGSIAVAHALGVDAASAVPRAYSALVEGARVELHAQRTGRLRVLSVGTGEIRADLPEFMVTVQPEGETGATLLHLADFPERARRLIRTTLRHELLSRSLTTAELRALAQGDATLRELVGHALVRSIERLAVDAGEEPLRHAHAVLNLLEQLETSIPFDAQAAWWRVRSAQAPAAEAFATLGVRLGFDAALTGAAAPA